MKFELKPQALEDFRFFKRHYPQYCEKIKKLHRSILETPFQGLGKPEPLKGDLSGYWSRRITRELRLVYKIEMDCVVILQYRYHYS